MRGGLLFLLLTTWLEPPRRVWILSSLRTRSGTCKEQELLRAYTTPLWTPVLIFIAMYPEASY